MILISETGYKTEQKISNHAFIPLLYCSSKENVYNAQKCYRVRVK